MTTPSRRIDFSTVLAAAVHDMKNSLSLLHQSIEQLSTHLPTQDPQIRQHLASAHYEAARLNTDVVQILSLYRAEMENLPIHVDECYLEDLIDDLQANNQHYAEQRNIKLDVQQDRELVWYLDVDLVSLLLNDVLINAMRYSAQRILLKTFEQNGHLVFQIADDGPGYPANMLRANQIDMQEFDISQGRTGLGLFFAKLIAAAHSKCDRQGQIQLANGGELGGSVFTLKLP